MKGKSISFTIKTPHSTIKPDSAVKLNDAFKKEIERRAVKMTVENIARYQKVAERRAVTLISTFFQRVVSRTPLDERYETGPGYVDRNGIRHPSEHIPDKIQCRYDWFIEKDGVRLYAKEIVDAYADAFDKVNSKEGILSVEIFVKNFFGDKLSSGSSFSVGNENPYFATLEYGGYSEDGEIIKGTGNKYEHGVENKHSVQAPVGMLRISQMELEEIIRTGVSVNKYAKEKNVSKNLSNKELDSLVKLFKASKRLKLSDIKRYIK